MIAERYRLDSALSSGGMGTIFTATHTQTGRRLAVKIMTGDLSGDAEAERRFIREAKLSGSISHPCVIRVYDVGYEGDHPYMVMELLEGESLGARLKRGALGADEAAALMLRVVEGVRAAHAQGIVHRDLKPDNVFLCRSPDGRTLEPKVLDFGISKSVSGQTQLTRTGISLGTPLYMSPEQVHGQRDVDQRADVYALGVILYQMLTGRLPFEAATYPELVLKIITGDCRGIRAHDPRLPEALEAVVFKAMAPDRAERYASAEAFATDLRAFAQGVLLTPPRVSRASSRPSDRSPQSFTPFATEALREAPPELPKRRAPLLIAAVTAGAVLAAIVFYALRPDAAPATHAAQPPASPTPLPAPAPAPVAAPRTAPVLAPPAALPQAEPAPPRPELLPMLPKGPPERATPSHAAPRATATATEPTTPARHAAPSEQMIDPFE